MSESLKVLENLNRIYRILLANSPIIKDENNKKLTDAEKEMFNIIRKDLKAFNQVCELMKKYNIKDTNELEEIILRGIKK